MSRRAVHYELYARRKPNAAWTLELAAEEQLAFGFQRMDRGNLVGAAARFEIFREQVVDGDRMGERHRRKRNEATQKSWTHGLSPGGGAAADARQRAITVQISQRRSS